MMVKKKSINDLEEGEEFYSNIYDTFGIEEQTWSPTKVKELLRSLIKSGVIYDYTEARLYKFLLTRGLLNLSNRHDDFFKNLIRASRNEVGKKLIEDYAHNKKKNPPDLEPYGKNSKNSEPIQETVETSSSEQLSAKIQSQQDSDDKIRTTKQILKNINYLSSINVDEEAIQYYVNADIQDLWKNTFKEEEGLRRKKKKIQKLPTVERIRKEKLTDDKFHNQVITTFLDEFDEVQKIKTPKEISQHYTPFLMQKYVAYKIKSRRYFGNFSGTGSGKTLSAILASKIINSKMMLIICPNDVVNNWVNQIKDLYENDPKTQVITGKEIFKTKREAGITKYLVVNWDKIQQKQLFSSFEKLVESQKIDLIVLDEIHFSKMTTFKEKQISERRKELEVILSLTRKKNPQFKTLGLSATPVVNNLKEGKSLIQLLSRDDFRDVDDKSTVPNAVTLHEKITNLSIRQIPDYQINVIKEYPEVSKRKPPRQKLKELHKKPLAIEQYLTDARLEEIVDRIDGPTIIYTEYVGKDANSPNKTSIIDKLEKAVKDAGHTYGFYVGGRKDDLELFTKHKTIKVLIASRPISTGVDGLQSVCKNLIFNTLPWTHALYNQIIGRIVRTGQSENQVTIHHIIATIGGYPYDQAKLDRIKFKRTLADCAVDGLLPETNLVTPQQAAKAAVNWLERLDRGEFSCVVRGEIHRDPTPQEKKTYKRQLSDFSEFNRKIDSSKSSTTFKKWKKDPTEFKLYHNRYSEERKTWTVIPFKVMIKRIKQMSDRYMIGDFGCGEAFLYKEFGNRVKSFDLVTVGPEVTSADISDVSVKTLGKDKGIEDGGLDVIVFSLSLMHTNWADYIKEAHRCLANGQLMLIAVTTESLKRPRLSKLTEVIEKTGFEGIKQTTKGPFTFIDARKNE